MKRILSFWFALISAAISAFGKNIKLGVSGSFFPAGLTFNINGQYYTQGSFVGTAPQWYGDIDLDEIQSIVLTSKFPQSDGVTYLPSFRVVVINRRTYEEQVFYILAFNLQLTDLASRINALDSAARFTIYTGLLSVDYNPDAISDWGNVMLNDRMTSSTRVYNPNANTTDIFVYKKRHLAQQVWTVTGDQVFGNNSPYYL